MQPLPKFTLRDIDTRELSVCTPVPDRPLPTGSIGTIVAAHPEYGYYLVEFDAPRLLWCSSRANMGRCCPKRRRASGG
jgi:hypothetical protein